MDASAPWGFAASMSNARWLIVNGGGVSGADAGATGI